MTAQENDDWFTRLQKRLETEPDPSPEEAAIYAAERAAEKNTRFEWYQMQANGDIAVHISQYGVAGGHGSNDYVVRQSDEHYQTCCKEYDLHSPGDTRDIKRRLIDGKWVIELDEKSKSVIE